MRLFSSNQAAVFGLDIGYETLKLVEVKKNKNSPSLVGFSEAPLPERLLERDHFKNIASAANIIKEACRKAKPNPIRAKKIVSALPESFVFSKTIQMPKMSLEEYKKAVPIEAAQNLPIPAQEAYIDFQILIVHPNESQSDILLVATPKKLVDDYVKMTKMAGFELVALETKPLAVGRAVLTSYGPLSGTVIVEIGTEVSRLSIWDSNSIRLNASVNTGKNQILEGIKSDAVTPAKDSQQTVSCREGSASYHTVHNIVEETLNIIKYHQNRDYKPKPISRIMLCGSGAKIDGVKECFEQEIKIKTENITPKLGKNETLGTEYITSYGLALRSENED